VHLADHDLREGVCRLECHTIEEQLGPLLLLDHAKHPDVSSTDAGPDLHAVADRPEPEQSDAVLAGDDLVMTLPRRQAPLAGVADVRGYRAQRRLAGQLRDNPFTVVADQERGCPTHPAALNHHAPRVRVERVLDQLRNRLARVTLTAGEPSDEVERIGRPELER